MATNKHRVILRVGDLHILTDLSMSQCYRRYKQYRDELNKSPKQHITIWEYCTLEGIEDVNKVYEALGIKK